MKHELLGEVKLLNGDHFDAEAIIRHKSRDVKISIIREDQTLEFMLKFAAEVVGRLTELDKLAKRIATRDLRETYNNGWNEYDEVQDEGSFKTVSNQSSLQRNLRRN